MIGVLGGTGKIGGDVVKALRQKNVPFKCIVRDPAAVAAKLGPEVAFAPGDLSDLDSLVAAFQGLEKIFLVCGLDPDLGRLENNAIEAAKQCGVSLIVKLSAAEPMIDVNSPTSVGRQHLVVEQALRDSGLDWTTLRPTFLMQNSLSQRVRVATEHKLAMPVRPDANVSMIDTRDIAACAAVALTEDGHGDQTYTLTGVRITLGEAVNTFSRVLGRDIEYAFVPEETALANMARMGIPDWMREHFLGIGKLLSEERLVELTDDVRRITGRDPHDYASYVSNNAEAFGGKS
ncbi:MAG: SDR family oxidoreductase [Rhodospirillales bacterium]|nr:SDR family oxidoreductase [Rhodospirillales bacterium]